jgi:phosphohistidine phosphatase SixA
MSDQEHKQLADELKRIGDILERILESQTQRTQATAEWQASDLKFRQELIQGQQAILDSTQTGQRIQRRAIWVIVIAGVVAISLLIGSRLIGGGY